ncbi:MAG: type III pantothenate kinase [Flavobacteriales bacterium]|nr:type III pantothenate kinase [Flavobacteriales bacterium]
MMTHQLVLDIGNSRTKIGLFAEGRLLRASHLPNGDGAAAKVFLENDHVDRVVLGSVAAEAPDLITALASIAPIHVIQGDSPSPLKSAYSTMSTLGVDRLANAVGANRLFPDRPALAVDLGTCVTYDLVDASGTFLGGLISPGLRMRAKAMNTFSARLPLVEPAENVSLIGRSTEECLASGTHHGLLAELRSMISGIGQQQPHLAVVLTGGDAPRFARALENGIFAHPFLTLLGLHALSLHDSSFPRSAAAG